MSQKSALFYNREWTIFFFFLREGFYHITDLRGYDHILFVAALCLPYSYRDWKRILWLVTGFTIGHSVTPALSIYNKILISGKWIEFLIPLTILCAALYNMVSDPKKESYGGRYFIVTGFGLIHGLGFSNYLRSMMGKQTGIMKELLAFNVGLELGQIGVVSVCLLLNTAICYGIRIPQKGWRRFASAAIFSVALVMTVERASLL